VSIFMWWQVDVVLPEASEAKKSTVPRGVKKGQKTQESCAVMTTTVSRGASP
jgi:hypothetical protein